MNRPPRKKKENKFDKYDLNNPINQPIPEAPPAPKLRKVAISGTACQGKTTLINDMLARWPNFSTPEKSYRDVIKDKGLTINQEGNEANQKVILDALVDQIMVDPGTKKFIFDRCPLDNLVYTLWLNDKHPDRVSDKAVEGTITMVRESMKFLDAIFFIPITSAHKVPIVSGGQRTVDPEYIQEIDNLFKAVIRTQKLGVGKFFPLLDCPPVIEVFGDRETRIKMLELYINSDGEFVGGDETVMNELAQSVNGIHNVPDIITNPSK